LKVLFFEIVGGLGIFLYGINLMSDALKKIAGSKLKLFLEKTTNTPLKYFSLVFYSPPSFQSSVPLSALVVGLVRAGLMTLPSGCWGDFWGQYRYHHHLTYSLVEYWWVCYANHVCWRISYLLY
jgi:hypothetical protein